MLSIAKKFRWSTTEFWAHYALEIMNSLHYKKSYEGNYGDKMDIYVNNCLV